MPLAGEWRDNRECHLKPDLLLIYRKPDAEVLQLVRMGSHSELFRLITRFDGYTQKAVSFRVLK